MDTSHRPTRCVRNYIKNELFLVEDSLSHILTVNKFHLSKTIRMREKTCDRELRNTTPKYQNASTQSRAIKNTKTHKPRAKLQEMILKIIKKNPLKERRIVITFFVGRT